MTEKKTVIREREVREWQSSVVDQIFHKECLSTVPFNLKHESKLAILGFYLPPQTRVDCEQVQRLASFFENTGHDYEISVKWCSKTKNLLVYCQIGTSPDSASQRARHEQGGESVRLLVQPQPLLEYEPTSAACLTRAGVPEAGVVRIHALEKKMMSTVWSYGVLSGADLPAGCASDVIRHTFHRPYALSVLHCRRRIPSMVLSRISRFTGVEDVWVSWDTEEEVLVVCVHSK